jgi:hypothetical protein
LGLPLTVVGIYTVYKKIKNQPDIQAFLKAVPEIKEFLGQFTKEDFDAFALMVKEFLAEYKKNHG